MKKIDAFLIFYKIKKGKSNFIGNKYNEGRN